MTTSQTEHLKHLTNALRDIYKSLDEATAAALDHVEQTQGHKMTCGSCKTAGCCYQLTTISLPEGLALADALLSTPDASDGTTWRDVVPHLVRVAKEDTRHGLTRASRMKAAVPCAFLGSTRNVDGLRCLVYESRPGCCRFHNAVTPEENCHPTAPINTPIGSIDLSQLEGVLWETTFAMSSDIGVDVTTQAPVSLMTLACLNLILYSRGLDVHAT